MSAELVTLAQDFKDLGARLEHALAAQAATPPAVDAPVATPVTTVSVPADTAATLTVAPADSVQQVAEDAAHLGETILAPELGGEAAVSAIEKTIVADVATGDTAGALHEIVTTAKTLGPKVSQLQTTADTHTDEIAALFQRVEALAKFSPAERKYFNYAIMAVGVLFFVAVEVLGATGNTWANHNAGLGATVLAVALALVSTPLAAGAA